MSTFARIVTLALLTFWAPQLLMADNSPLNRIKWTSYAEAETRNTDSRKYFVYFYTDQCPACVMLKQNTFARQSVIDYINANYIPIKVNAAKEPKLASRFRIQGVPDLRFLSPQGEDIGKWLGYIEPQHLLTLLQYIKTDSYEEISYKEFVQRQSNPGS